MQRMQKKIGWCVLGFFILSLIACVYWLSPDSENTSPQPNQDEAKSLVATSQSTLNSSLNENTYLSKSQQDTQVNCQLKIDSVHDKFHRTLILSGFCLLKIAKISLNSSFFPKPIKR